MAISVLLPWIYPNTVIKIVHSTKLSNNHQNQFASRSKCMIGLNVMPKNTLKKIAAQVQSLN